MDVVKSENRVLQQKMSLESVYPLVQQRVDSLNKMQRAQPTRQALDAFYFHCAQQAEQKSLSDEFRQEILRYFDHELFVCDEKGTESFVMGIALNEAVFGSVIKLHLSGGDTEAAWMLIKKLRGILREQGGEKVKLHFRTVSPLLEHECRHGQFPSAYSRWQQLREQDVEWTSAMEDVLMQMVIACVKHHDGQPDEYMVPESGDSESHFHAQMASLLHDLQIVCREVTPSNAQRLWQAFRDAEYNVEIMLSDARMRPNCPSCGHSLLKQGLTELEREQMLTAIETRQTKVGQEKTVKPYLKPFRDWLMLRHQNFVLENLASDSKTGKPLHYVLDGPNIAYMNQNFDDGTYRIDHVDAVARELQAQGHLVSITVPSVYLNDKFVVRIRTKNINARRRQGKYITRERTPAETAILERWAKENIVFSCRTDFLSDDLFWLYASVLLGREGRVVTNDQGRDHMHAMLNGYTSTSVKQRINNYTNAIPMDLIIRWKELTNVNIEMQHKDIVEGSLATGEMIPIDQINLLHPLPFSRVPQVTAPDHFHIPIAEHANQNEHPNQNNALAVDALEATGTLLNEKAGCGIEALTILGRAARRLTTWAVPAGIARLVANGTVFVLLAHVHAEVDLTLGGGWFEQTHDSDDCGGEEGRDLHAKFLFWARFKQRNSKQDASYRHNMLEKLELLSGRVGPKMDLGVEFTFTDGREMVGRVFSRADQAQWVSAFYQLAMKSEVRRVKSASMEDQGDNQAVEKRRVSFFGSVLVRTIPTVPDDQVPELFYSKKDVAKFSEQASSLRSRTEDAVSLACKSFRKPTLPWRRQVV
ncbi:hypothetical protein BBP00_00007732 [Phytophthora kernoviae]|uniref:Uncharacterized protein n=1 Tax=Phytophthora kernoviae TaxID=325452 RepID=A0A3F2RJG0_9STRA|nr:hypothetical protein BBP00_00007732 [Phytophthora kernoviae]